MDIKKNDVLTATVKALGFNGEGIIDHFGTTVFVPFSLAGEKIDFKVLKVKGNVAFGKVKKVISPSISRLTPVCPVFFKCGGCQLQHLEYPKQLDFKAETVKNCFKKIAGLDVDIDKKFASPNVYAYRNKLQLPTRALKSGNAVGFFRPNSHDVVKTDVCPIHPEWANKVISAVNEFIEKSGVSLYDEVSGKGVLRHVVVREINGEYLFTFVINAKTLKNTDLLTDILKRDFGKFSLYLNENTSDSNVILGERFELCFGKGYITVTEFGVTYDITPQAFYQVNTPVKTEIYNDVLSFVSSGGDTAVIDGYAGAGVLTAMLAKKCAKSVGVEIVKEACDSAVKLAADNRIDNMEFICGDCEKVLPELIEKVRKTYGRVVLVLDPPRKGVDVKTLTAALKNPPDEIIYISCSPQTLARDVGVLTGSLKYENNQLINLSKDFSPNYDLKFVGIYDMFAQTKHVETVVRLSRQ
ncbi:MAG: 23S rRNA (uracil(1939)-C(5))-methyltransferase RlmD [Clostridia bacterium]|nr:23S rRNA (uracil(1939)-C(5))-methyltransferase RlmD [Clostridia bacterium]